MSLGYDLFESWKNRVGSVNSMEDILKWIEKKNNTAQVCIEKKEFPDGNGIWFFDNDTGFIRNRNNSFFQIVGFQVVENDIVIDEQPLIKQTEIGYLGIICKKINGVLNFLMQVKIEPGNINFVQLSPTIQATKSNFTRKHGGSEPPYLRYFLHSSEYHILCDQIQSEQSSRFYKKRNRNIVILIDEDIEVLPTHMWMTLGQIKELLKIDNLVNMDTRTVLSGLPLCTAPITESEQEIIKSFIDDKTLYYSMFDPISYTNLTEIYNVVNDRKMFSNTEGRIVSLRSLKNWECKKNEIECKSPYNFKVVYCDVSIEGREVMHWEQPMIEATGMAIFGLFTTVINGVRNFLITIKNEVGCFDCAEMGPSVQIEAIKKANELDSVEQLFMDKLKAKNGIVSNIVLSEEGGRFYHEENQNIIIDILPDEIKDLPKGYFWVSYMTLNYMTQINNVLNIQLRNLLTLVDL